MSSGPGLPSGTVTFLFTDIEGSTRLLTGLGRERYGVVMADHASLLRAAVAEHSGEVIDTQGDSFFVAFRTSVDAVQAAVGAQRSLAEHVWPVAGGLLVRMGIHTGEATLASERYLGLAVHRASRIGAAGHGGQVLLSNTTRELVEDELPEGVWLRDLGVHRLKDLDRPEHLSQLCIDGLPDEFPPLRTVADETLFAGREEELEKAAQAAVTRPRFYRRRTVLIGALAGVIAAAVAIPIFALGGGSGGSISEVRATVAADSVGVFDARNGNPIAQAQVRSGPNAVAIGEGAIWVTNVDDNSVSRLDPTTNASVQSIPVGRGPDGVAVGGGFVWVANGLDGTVSKIDPRTNSEVAKVQVGNGPSGVALGAGSVWVANSTDRSVTRIDPVSGMPRKTIQAGAGADGIAFGDGAVWVTSDSAGSVTRIDPQSGSVVEAINVGRGASALAAGAGAVWVANSLGNTVSRVNPGSNDVQATIPVAAGPSGIAIAADGKSVWVSSEIEGTLSRIAQDKVVQTVKTGNRPQSIAVAGNTMYVAVRTSGLAHRGGTLTVLTRDTFDSIDPAVAYILFSWSAMILTNDGLVAFKRVGGSDGARVVPDLATSIPTPTDGGTAYTFQVRRGIHYSTGAVVEPADFRRGIERALATPGGFGQLFLSSFVGASACAKTLKRCDLSKGIVVDPAAYTVTFHLTKPDPDFLVKLAFPAADAVPASTPLKAKLPLPATGPYMIASYDAKRGVRLIRNPRFRVWYEAAQPDGYPAEIVWRFGVLPSAQLPAVERGKADLAVDAGSADDGGFAPRARFTALRTQYASLLHINPGLSTLFVFLNTRLAPFNNLQARQAVNYAVDRNRLVDLRGGPDNVQATCQVLPPNLDGYRRYCPYTIDPNPGGTYTGPDLTKARRLVAASGTTGQAVTLWQTKRGIARGGAYLATVLQSLGYRTRLKVINDQDAFFAITGDSRRRVQAAFNGWLADYPSAGDFFPALLTCSSFAPGGKNNTNYAEFCDRRIDSEIDRAQALQTTDPGAASRLWSKIDHDVVDQAPWIFQVNPQHVDFVSRRVGNYQYNPQWGALLDQLWVR